MEFIIFVLLLFCLLRLDDTKCTRIITIFILRSYRANHVDVRISYESIGSGAGRARIKGEQLPTVDFAGSDSALTKQEQEDYPDLIMFPTLAG